MRYTHIMKLLAACLLLCTALAVAAPPAASRTNSLTPRERARIHALLDALERSGLVFIRNGSEHTAPAARAHLEMKLDRAGGRITTAEQFIDRLASRSSSTGRPYMVRLGNGTEVQAGMWLRTRLAEIDAKEKNQGKGTP